MRTVHVCTRPVGAPSPDAVRCNASDNNGAGPRHAMIQWFLYVNHINIQNKYHAHRLSAMENRSARITVLIDPVKKQLFEEICAEQDLTPSQVIRKLIREYIVEHAGSRDLPDSLKTTAPKPEGK
ncbi:hypothetical protein [Thiocapsa marina]|uniref:CopG-like domain-containing protein DNA-binding n=1 Tax=Thiocapsa marina 5811 TaxID=768671 RepID=F9UC56_9GAMM|nr:hypothetical protein [Thiocapsa marina]EGV17969.1 CopG-like domain-containing protein DNA-binding [Thiocapsa marina 5811]